MAGTQIQYRRGSDTQNDAFTGALGEITVDTTRDELRVHDGSTAGGFPISGYTLYQAVLNGQSDGVGNIGNATTGFNTVFAKSTSAQYADLAERYATDSMYEPGTVVVIGGDKEATACSSYADHKVLGIISTDPAYKMNQRSEGQDVALTGRVPCKVVGTVERGDLLVTSATGGHAQAWDPQNFVPGSVVGKALESKSGDGAGVIEVAVGKV
jgi:hypothetical protein